MRRLILLAAELTAVIMIILLATLVRNYVEDQAERRIQDTMPECRTFHHYVQRDMHIAYYKLMEEGRLPRGF